MTWVKICGITNLEDAQVAVDAGADAVGFVFYEKSPRNVDPETALRIVKELSSDVEKVGVFVNESAQSVAEIADKTGLTGVQLHVQGNRPFEKQVTGKKVFLVLAANLVRFPLDGGPLSALPDNLAAILIDSGTAEQPGGTGRSFDWEEAKAFVSVVSAQYPVVVAGGLTPGNVADAMRTLRPWGVDVSSGVEANPGKKDPAKVRAFIQAVRGGRQEPINMATASIAKKKSSPAPDQAAPGRFGVYGGRYAPETLMAALEELERAYEKAKCDRAFQRRLDGLLRTYAGRPTPLFFAARLTRKLGGAKIYL